MIPMCFSIDGFEQRFIDRVGVFSVSVLRRLNTIKSHGKAGLFKIDALSAPVVPG